MAIEAALDVARAGLRADPVVMPPAALRRYVDFTKLSPVALAAVARIIDRDDDFRARVAEAVDPDRVGPAGWLWLTRPTGWAERLAEIEAEDTARATKAQEARDERSTARRLAAAQSATARAEALAAERGVEVDRLRRELAEERSRRVAGDARLEELEDAVDRLTAARTAAVRNLKDAEARLVQRSTEFNALKVRLRALEASAAGAGSGSGAGAAGGTEAGSVAAAAAGSEAGGESPDTGDRGAAPGASPAGREQPLPGGASALADELDRAARGAASLADGLARMVALVSGAEAPGPAGAPAGEQLWDRRGGRSAAMEGGEARGAAGAAAGAATGGAVGGGAARGSAGASAEAGGAGAGGAAPPAQGRATGRRPVALPGGVLDDSVEAAEHLLRTPGAVLVVDGYNVTMAGWSGLAAVEQRRRLVAALADLAARTSTRVELVFDGADDADGPVAVPAPARQLVRVRFSPPGVEADDVVLELVAQLPGAWPVIVASSDNRVRDGARRGGANLIHARQLLATLGVGSD